MKRHFAFSVGLALLAGMIWAHDQLRGTAKAAVAGGEVEVEFGRPMFREEHLAAVEPGLVWRMGADAPTSLTTSVKLKNGETVIRPGQYALLARFEGDDQWSLIVNSGDVRGSRRDEDEDVAVVPMTLAEVDFPADHLAIELETWGESVALHVVWGATRLSAEFAAEPAS
jgi:hypothetical protein